MIIIWFIVLESQGSVGEFNIQRRSSTLFFSMLRKLLLGNYYEARNVATFSLIFTRASFLRGEKNFFFKGEGFSTEPGVGYDGHYTMNFNAF